MLRGMDTPMPLNLDCLPATIGVAEFDALHDHLPAWQAAITALAATLSPQPVQQMDAGTVLVALLGDTQVIKLYPPFLRDHFAFERAALQQLGGRLSVPTPVLLRSGEQGGWPWLLMTQLQGEALTEHWPRLDEASKCSLLHRLGELTAEVHAQPVGAVRGVGGPRESFDDRGGGRLGMDLPQHAGCGAAHGGWRRRLVEDGTTGCDHGGLMRRRQPPGSLDRRVGHDRIGIGRQRQDAAHRIAASARAGASATRRRLRAASYSAGTRTRPA